MTYREYAQPFSVSDPPHHEVIVEVVVPNRAPEYTEHRDGVPEPDWENCAGKFYSHPEDAGKTFNWSIKNKTDNELLDSGEFTCSASEWHMLALVSNVPTLRGKTVEFKFWNPSENNTKPLMVHGIVFGGPTY